MNKLNLSQLAEQVVKCVARSVRNGNVYVPLNELVQMVRGQHSDAELVMAIHEVLDEGVLVKTLTPAGKTVVYQPSLLQMEKSAAQRLKLLAGTPVAPIKVELSNNNLSEEQANAVYGCLASKVAVLTGGPGTGKTTTLRAAIDAADRAGLDVILCAPTGQAAKRMSAATGREASTVHRMLGYNPETKEFNHSPDNYLPGDLIVIDESSMLDLWLLHHLLRAVDGMTRILFVGDVNQLPSVGAGNVLNDIIHSGIAHVAMLTKTFRQGEGSRIIESATAIKTGVMPNLDNKGTDFFLFRVPSEETGQVIADVVVDKIPQHFGFQPEEIQVLSPMYKGVAGVDDINSRLQERLNDDSTWYVKHKNGTFKVGDRIVQTKNNYDVNIMNGEVGNITFINKKNKTVSIKFGDETVRYAYSDLWQIKLAYAITIHRSQGSEYAAVVIPVVENMSMLQRNLLYTAITRAKKLVVLVGSEAAIEAAINDVSATQRWTALADRIKE
ncbi:MAG: AAA family ATPase [Chloroflexota bacterium]